MRPLSSYIDILRAIHFSRDGLYHSLFAWQTFTYDRYRMHLPTFECSAELNGKGEYIVCGLAHFLCGARHSDLGQFHLPYVIYLVSHANRR